MVALSDIDTSIRVHPAFMRSTVGMLPNSQTQGAGARMPLGVVIRPMALDDSEPDFVDVVDFGSTGIVRCKRCR
jgi:protein transport protein SEC24